MSGQNYTVAWLCDSWVEKDGDRCYQLMETEQPELFQKWTSAWSDLVSFQILELE